MEQYPDERATIKSCNKLVTFVLVEVQNWHARVEAGSIQQKRFHCNKEAKNRTLHSPCEGRTHDLGVISTTLYRLS